MRRLAVLVVLFLVASLTVSACGGGGGDAQPTETGSTSGSQQQAAPPPPTGQTTQETPAVVETSTAKPFLITGETPQFFKDLIELKTPMVVIFFSKSVPAWADVQKEIAAVEKRYSNQAEFEKLSMDEPYNMAALPQEKRAKAQEIANLAEQFGVKFTPFIAVIDRNSMVTYTHSGYIDSKTLEQELYKALKR